MLPNDYTLFSCGTLIPISGTFKINYLNEILGYQRKAVENHLRIIQLLILILNNKKN